MSHDTHLKILDLKGKREQIRVVDSTSQVVLHVQLHTWGTPSSMYLNCVQEEDEFILGILFLTEVVNTVLDVVTTCVFHNCVHVPSLTKNLLRGFMSGRNQPLSWERISHRISERKEAGKQMRFSQDNLSLLSMIYWILSFLVPSKLWSS